MEAMQASGGFDAAVPPVICAAYVLSHYLKQSAAADA